MIYYIEQIMNFKQSNFTIYRDKYCITNIQEEQPAKFYSTHGGYNINRYWMRKKCKHSNDKCDCSIISYRKNNVRTNDANLMNVYNTYLISIIC